MRVMGRRGMVASPHYLATEAGITVLRRGGSAVDAAIATNAVLAVVVPYMCGLGGDLFAQVYTAHDEKLAGLNGSGRAPAAATVERIRELGGDVMPVRGALSVTVPGCVEAWEKLHGRYGQLALDDILADAIAYAEDGFPVTAEFVSSLDRSRSFLHPATPALETFFPAGQVLREGQILKQPRLAKTLRSVAQLGARDFYHGHIAEELVRSLRAVGGLISEQDLTAHHSDWVEPLSVDYRDTTVFELPPNSQGMIALLMLSMMQHLPERAFQNESAGYVHLLAEIARLAYADRDAFVTDPVHMKIAPERLIAATHARAKAQQVGETAAARALAGTPGDTVYLCTADRHGNLVSLIESNFMGIGSGVMAGETGVMMQNRGAWFTLEPEHANMIAPRKRTMHTLMPGMAFRQGKPWLVFGCMGGSTQAQIHVQLLTRILDQHLAIDEALDAPRFDAVAGTAPDGRPVLLIESRFASKVFEELEQRGHAVSLVGPYSSSMGHAHAIEVSPDGVYTGAADPRTNSLAIGY